MTTSLQSEKRAPLAFLGIACAVGVSTMYYNQPLLLEMGRSYGVSAGHVGFVAVATQVGYACGLLSFVPLGDVLERRALMMKMYGAEAIALLLVAVAPGLTWLIAASVLIGLFASVTHVALPIAPDLVSHEKRGRAIGTVMTGLLLGILLARTFAGWVSGIHGWRWVFVVAAVVNAAFVPLMGRVMPKLPPKQQLRYADAMRSLWTLFRTQPLLRESSVVGALVFASFSCFWTTLAFVLHSHYGLGAGVAGTFGVVGAAGALVAPLAGRLSDRHGSRWVISLGMGLLTSSYVLLWVEEPVRLPMTVHIIALAVGVLVLDIGAQMIQVANQTRILGLVPSARSRINTVYMTVYFSGAAVGSALATVAWEHWKWNGVCCLAIGFIALAGLRHAAGSRDAGADHHRITEEDLLLEA
ncbi:MFS transporter [Tunturibacter empetritectus]|uniref:MFS family arabinose efflux permease n=1 Tax=Tunturiibacter empetritectus TaxID=3069691 RepID=A0A7W8IHA8_9BACT|nr:MFS transporter [Edaphobacter lichenicola]MBB5317135.1 putative MFS family arabinose efflux permease [Edaphobacter lichenicola]